MKELIRVIREAGAIALEEQKNLIISDKKDLSIVTNGDLAVSSFLEKELKLLYPDHDIFSEENASNLPTSKKVIIIDPIDGTESYSRSEDSWSVLIGFLDDMIPVGGIIYQPTKDILFYGFKGLGSFKETNNCVVKLRAEPIGKTSAIQSFRDYGELDFLTNLGVENIDHMYSAALKILKVAAGEIDLYPNFRGKCSLWDLVAPQIILEEAGGNIEYDGKVLSSFSSPQIINRFCAVSKRFPGPIF
jgi:3'(2'), 5'-bisphosphate nucleotidase